jgi:SAM-dependent methyltransferase
MGTVTKEQQNVQIIAYPCEMSSTDTVGDSQLAERVAHEFGHRYLRGCALMERSPDESIWVSREQAFRNFLPRHAKHILEIGTFRGPSTALLAHYADHVTTIDIQPYYESVPVWVYFGVGHKIQAVIVDGNDSKAELIGTLDFDFAFVDADHMYEGAKLDFNLVKKCGRVLFHDYGDPRFGITKLVDELPRTEVTIDAPFAYWEKPDV